jgi:hypothetical protein
VDCFFAVAAAVATGRWNATRLQWTASHEKAAEGTSGDRFNQLVDSEAAEKGAEDDEEEGGEEKEGGSEADLGIGES